MSIHMYTYASHLSCATETQSCLSFPMWCALAANDPTFSQAWVVGGQEPRIMTSKGDLRQLAARMAQFEALLAKKQRLGQHAQLKETHHLDEHQTIEEEEEVEEGGGEDKREEETKAESAARDLHIAVIKMQGTNV